MGVYHLRIALAPLLPGLGQLLMRYDNAAQKQVFDVEVAGERFKVPTEMNATTEEIIASILTGVKKQEDTSNGTANDIQPGTGGPTDSSSG